MKFSEANSNLGLTTADYFYQCYKQKDFGILGVRSLARKDGVQAYVIASDTNIDRHETLFKEDIELAESAFNVLLSLPQFFFILIVQNYRLDNVYIPDELFYSEDEAFTQAKEELKHYKKNDF